MYGVYRAGALYETSVVQEPGDVKITDSALLPDSWWMIIRFTAILPESYFRVFNTCVYIGRPRNGPYLEIEYSGGPYFAPKDTEVVASAKNAKKRGLDHMGVTRQATLATKHQNAIPSMA
jgi:hypothetical protein